MKVITYMCEKCFEPYIFNPEDKRSEYICPKCGEKLMYWSTEDIDPITKKVTNRYDEDDRKMHNPGKPISSEFSHLIKPSITCPYCQSTNTKKLPKKSLFLSHSLFWGNNLNEVGKNFHCNNCGADF